MAGMIKIHVSGIGAVVELLTLISADGVQLPAKAAVFS